MKITPEIRSIQNAYMTAKSENDQTEMKQLKAEALTLMNIGSSDKTSETTPNSDQPNTSKVKRNEDGDELTISLLKRDRTLIK